MMISWCPFCVDQLLNTTALPVCRELLVLHAMTSLLVLLALRTVMNLLTFLCHIYIPI